MNLVKEFLLLKAKVDKLYCQLIAKSSDERDPTVPNHVKTIKQEDIDNWNNVKEEEVQITEDTVFAQIGQTQKDFNRSVSDYKTSSDLKNQEQDNRLSDIEGENIAQNDLINGLQADLNNQIAINANQDERIVNLENINYIWSPTNRTLTLFDSNGTQLSQVSLVSLDNEGTDIRYNASTLSLELYNADNELLDSIPVSSFIGSVGTQLQLNSNQLQLKDSQGNVLSTVSFSVSNINGLQSALNSKLDKSTYTGTAQDLKNDIDGIQIGGRNLLVGSNYFKDFNTFGNGSIELNKTLKIYNSSFGTVRCTQILNITTAGYYTISFTCLEINSSNKFFIELKNSTTGVGSNQKQIVLGKNVFTLYIPTGNYYIVNFLATAPSLDNTKWCLIKNDIKVEIGNKATDWTPAPEDKLDVPTTTGNTTTYPYVVGENGNGGSARLPAGDLGKNFFNSDLSNTTARNHTMNAGVTVNTLGNPYTISGLPNKNADIANFRKVRVQNASGLDSIVDSKNLLTDGMTSMTDAEKDAWRLAQRKTGENYSSAMPQVNIIFPIQVKGENFLQNITCLGVNLFIDTNNQNSRVFLKNTVTGLEYTISNVGVSQFDTGYLSFWYNISEIPEGDYFVRIKNQLGITSIDTQTFKVVNSLTLKAIPNFSWNLLLNSGYTLKPETSYNSNNLYYATKGTTGDVNSFVAAFKSTVPILTQNEASGNWQIHLKWNYGIWGIGNGGFSFGIDKTSKELSLIQSFIAGLYNTNDGNVNFVNKTIPDVSGSYNPNFQATSLPSSGVFIIEKIGLMLRLIHVFDNNNRLLGKFTLAANLDEDISAFVYFRGSNTTLNGDISNITLNVDKIILN